MKSKKVGIASDHAGYQMKEFIVGYLDSKGYDVHDFGCYSEESCDYPDFAHELANSIENGEVEMGFALCGSANGISMALNKHKGIRAAICWEAELAELARVHNDANVCSLPARFIENDTAQEIVDIFLATPTSTVERHMNRVAKISI